MFWKLFTSNLKMFSRNRQASFWALFFPLIFTFIFGLFFGKTTTVGTIGEVNKSNTQIAKALDKALIDSKLLKIEKFDSVDEAKSEMKKNTISAVLVVPEDFGDFAPGSPTQVQTYYDQGNAQVNSVLIGFLNSFLTNASFQSQNAKMVFSVDAIKISDRELTYFDFVLAGILGLALMNSSIIGIAIAMSKYREDKILKRITTTPLPTWVFIVAEVLSRLVLNIFQVTIILLVGYFVFDAHIYGSLFVLIPLVLVGAILFQLLGFVIASFSKTADAAQGMATALTIPMMFLTGVFFPIDQLPKWLYSIVQFLPLAPLLRMIRQVMLEATSPFDNPINAIIVAAWIVGALLISIWKFRLTEE